MNFIPYIDDQKSDWAQRDLKKTMEECNDGEKEPSNEGEGSDEDWFLEADLTQPGLDIEKVKKASSGINVTPFDWKVGDTEYKMNFISGFAGARILDDQYIKA